MNIEERYIGKDKLELRVTENPKLYGFIEPYEDKARPFILKYFYNDKYQDCDFADDMAEGKERLGDILKTLYSKNNENKLYRFNNFLNEGKYDKMVGILVDDILSEIKESKEDYDGEDEEDFNQFKLGDYTGTMKKVSVLLDIKRNVNGDVNFDESDVTFFKSKGFIIDAYCINEEIVNVDDYYNDGLIHVTIIINPEDEPKIYQDMISELHDVVRHESEHLTQDGVNRLKGKVHGTSLELRQKIYDDPERFYLYYLLKDEIPSLVRGMYKKAKWSKRTLNDVFGENLDSLVDRNMVIEKDREKLLRVWSNYAKKHLPKAKWN